MQITKEMLSDEQSLALKKIGELLFGDVAKPVFLTAGAGFGKSSIVGIFLQDCFDSGFVPILTAPTHVAKDRLEGLHPECAPITIQSFLSYSVISHNYAKSEFGFTGKNTEASQFDVNKNVLIVDEVSMLTDEFINEILRKTKGRVLFVGDIAQIPPVISGDFDRTKILTEEESTPGVIRKVENVIELTTPFRQSANSSLYHVCSMLRESIFTGECIDYYHNPVKMMKKIDEIINDIGDKSVFTNIKTEQIKPFLVKYSGSVFIAYGNPTVDAVQRVLPEWYRVGGRAMTNGCIMNLSRNNGKMKGEIVIGNNTDVEIKELEKRALTKWDIDFDSISIDGVQAFVPSISEEFDKKLDELRASAKINEKNRGKSTFDEDKQLSNWSLSAFMSKVVVLRDARVSTVHRAQGLQWDRSIVAMNNILFSGKNMNPDRDSKDIFRKIVAMKMLYTAISRPKKTLVINRHFDKRRV